MECHKKDSLFSGVTGKERDTGTLGSEKTREQYRNEHGDKRRLQYVERRGGDEEVLRPQQSDPILEGRSTIEDPNPPGSSL
ncbi:unnamed protein product [Arctogadus glacialis]